ncbi:hypothetical protein SETIT_8G044900v2 [Setaria italica]|uniref:Uncharacterized protein n=1 Tax=Setaria italica TaxID=4555 RepID=A0A368S4B7_SETIT|nr:hypothetical protein SETIT_8G044900v2 [Setaria italica]
MRNSTPTPPTPPPPRHQLPVLRSRGSRSHGGGGGPRRGHGGARPPPEAPPRGPLPVRTSTPSSPSRSPRPLKPTLASPPWCPRKMILRWMLMLRLRQHRFQSSMVSLKLKYILLVLIFLIDQKKYADTCSTWVRLGQFSWSTLMLKKASSKLLGRHPHQLVVFVFSATNGLSL